MGGRGGLMISERWRGEIRMTHKGLLFVRCLFLPACKMAGCSKCDAACLRSGQEASHPKHRAAAAGDASRASHHVIDGVNNTTQSCQVLTFVGAGPTPA